MQLSEQGVDAIARVTHDAIRAYQAVLGQPVTPAWEDATWERDSSRAAVRFALEGRGSGAQHEEWMRARLTDGWTYGDVKDVEKKTNPALLPFDQLPKAEQVKDALVIAIVQALVPAFQ
jgi:hypothetical protein